MKIPLIKISDDAPIEAPYRGKYRNLDGTTKHGVYIRKYRNTIDKLFINNGHSMRIYKYPIIKQKFSSPRINDYNLHLCGGWAFRRVKSEEALTRVISNLKPMGFLVTKDVEKWEDVCKKSGLLYSIVPNHIPTEEFFDIGISCNGTFGSLFDLQNLAADYVNYAIKVQIPFSTEEVKSFILSLKDIQISSYLTSDYANPATNQELIINGLILGYPIETTVSIMWVQ